MYLVVFIIRMYHDTWSSERQNFYYKTLVNSYQTTQRHYLKESNLHYQLRENLPHKLHYFVSRYTSSSAPDNFSGQGVSDRPCLIKGQCNI